MPVYGSRMSDSGPTKRPYRMGARAKAAEATRKRILGAVDTAYGSLPLSEVTLTAIAERAGVSVQTVLRHFGSRDGVLMAALAFTGEEMAGDRMVEPDADLEEIVGVLVDHYEKFGDRILRWLAQEESVPRVRVRTDMGRGYHLQWCKDAFAPVLSELGGAERERRAIQLAALLDIYVWKILRRDRGLSVAETKLALREMIEPLTGPSW